MRAVISVALERKAISVRLTFKSARFNETYLAHIKPEFWWQSCVENTPLGSAVDNNVVVVVPHTARNIDPGEPANMNVLLAFEWTQASPQSVCLNDVAS